MFNLTSIIGIIICTTLLFLLVTVIILICHRHKYNSSTIESDEYGIPGRIPGFNAPLNPTNQTNPTCYSNNTHDNPVPIQQSDTSTQPTLTSKQTERPPPDVPPAYDSIILPLAAGGCDVIKVPNTDEGASELASMICQQNTHQHTVEITPHYVTNSKQSMFIPYGTKSNLPYINDTLSVINTTKMPTAPPRDDDDYLSDD